MLYNDRTKEMGLRVLSFHLHCTVVGLKNIKTISFELLQYPDRGVAIDLAPVGEDCVEDKGFR